MGVMDQAAGIVGGGTDEETTPKPSGRPILTVSGRAPAGIASEPPVIETGTVQSSDSVPVPDQVVQRASGPAAVVPLDAAPASSPGVESEAPVFDPSTPQASVESGGDVAPSSQGDVREEGPASPEAVESVKDAGTSSVVPEDGEHEGVELARKAKAEEEKEAGATDGGKAYGSAEGVDPVAEGIASAMGGGTAETDPNSVVAVGPVVTEESAKPGTDGTEPAGAPMSYHDALNHLNRTAARRGHVDIDDRITEYVRTRNRDALDRPSRATKKREDRAIRDGTVDPKLLEARRIVEGGITSKDIKVQAAIDAVGARTTRSATDEVKSKTKGPAASRPSATDGIDPAVAAAAAGTREAPGL